MAKKIQKILITGGLGHIGSALIRNLSKNIAKEVIILDSLESRRFPSLFDLPKGFKFKFFKEDILTANFNKYLSGVDIVIHLAAINYHEDGYKYPKKIEAENYLGLKKVADACLTSGVKLLFPSTTSVYGSRAISVDEESTLKPQSPHAESKFNCEKYIEKLGKKGLKYVICRFGTIYGFSVGMRFDTAVNKFVWQAVNGFPLSVWNTAWKQKRPYLYLLDAINAINFIIEKDLFNDQIYNVLTENFAVKDVVKTIKQYIPKLKVEYTRSPLMNNLNYEANDDKFRSLGFKTSGKLKIGIKETVDQLKGIIRN